MGTQTVQLLMSVAALILTPVFSAVVVAFQLSRSHRYWTLQQQSKRIEEILKLKVDLLGRATTALNQLNELVVTHHIYASSRDIALALAQLLQDREQAAFYRREYEVFREKAAGSWIAFRDASIKAREVAAAINVYFGTDAGARFTSVRDRCNVAIRSPLSPLQIRDALQELLRKGVDIEAAKMEVSHNYDQQYDVRRPKSATQAALSALLSSAMGDFESVVKETSGS